MTTAKRTKEENSHVQQRKTRKKSQSGAVTTNWRSYGNIPKYAYVLYSHSYVVGMGCVVAKRKSTTSIANYCFICGRSENVSICLRLWAEDGAQRQQQHAYIHWCSLICCINTKNSWTHTLTHMQTQVLAHNWCGALQEWRRFRCKNRHCEKQLRVADKK